MSVWIDYHSHSERMQSDGEIRVCSLDLREPKTLSGLGTRFTYFTAGVHPWYVNELSPVPFALLRRLLQTDGCLGLGECGLDKTRGPDLETQRKCFLAQLNLAAELGISVAVIHCVRAYAEVLRCKNESQFEGSLVFHDYNGSPEFTKRALADCGGVYFSYGNALRRVQSRGFQSLALIPRDRLLVETDASAETIESRYLALANALNQPLMALQAQIRENFSCLHGVTYSDFGCKPN